MRELSYNEFDRIFKEKSQDFDYQFEEEAWLLMEKKLRKRYRVIYFRNFSIAALLLLFLATGLYLFNQQNTSNSIVNKTPRKNPDNLTAKQHTNSPGTPTSKENKEGNSSDRNLTREKLYTAANSKGAKGNSKSARRTISTELLKSAGSSLLINHQSTLADSLNRLNGIEIAFNNSLVPSDFLDVPKTNLSVSTNELSKPKNTPFKPSYSFTFSAGPDFSSTTALAGKRGNLNLGLLLNASYKKFTLTTGVRYGVKKYDAEALDYALRNPSRAKDIYNIDASCNVLEIPVQFSVTAKS